MPLQNRVAPFGDIVAISARGTFTGNRGIIHDPNTRALLPKRWSSKAWLVCMLEFQGRHRDVMAKQSWTELFFLDEATALAAGHRPCFHCRRADARRFRAAWQKANGRFLKMAAIDAVLHRERLDSRAKRLHPLPYAITDLPDGAMIAADDDAYVVVNGKTLNWSFDGYTRFAPPRNALLLTPPSILRAMRAGYTPALHASALT